MHPGPMNRGVEIDSQVADHPTCSLITRQVETRRRHPHGLPGRADTARERRARLGRRQGVQTPRPLTITGGRLVLPEGEPAAGALRCENGRIVAIGNVSPAEGDDVIDARAR
jgi:hypothetical protein